MILVTVYVGDMLIIGTPSDIDQITEDLRKRFVLKALGHCMKVH